MRMKSVLYCHISRSGLPKVAGGRERRKEDGIQNAEHRTQNAELKMDRPVRMASRTAKSGVGKRQAGDLCNI